MKNIKKDLLGQKFTRWSVVDVSEKKKRRTAWKVRCDCGKISCVATNNLTTGKSKSCGCLQREKSKQHLTKHGQRYTPLYRRWLGMRSRCSIKAPQRKDYYDRGIGVCSEWDNFMNFKKDMGGSFKQELTLDRIDNNKGYFKENCRWVDRETQNNNQKRSHRVKHKGNEYTIREFCEKYNLVYNTIRRKVIQGVDVTKLIHWIKIRNIVDVTLISRASVLVEPFIELYVVAWHTIIVSHRKTPLGGLF